MTDGPADRPSGDPEPAGSPCGRCGAAPGADAALTWSTAVEGGRTVRLCAACTREHVRAIEGKLDAAWW